jgi:hypothetical protein
VNTTINTGNSESYGIIAIYISLVIDELKRWARGIGVANTIVGWCRKSPTISSRRTLKDT